MVEVTLARTSGKIAEMVYEKTDSEIAEEIAVTSSVVTVIHTAMLGLIQVLCIELEFEDTPERIAFRLPKLEAQTAHDAQIILQTMLCGLSDLAVTFSDFLKLEVN